MASKLVRFSEFNPKTDNWDNYIVRLRYCFEANGIDDDSVKRANFCTVCGSETFEILLALLTPKKSSDVTFEEIVLTLTKHFSPKPNEISMSYKFYKRDQAKNETSAEYIAQLRKISADCNFPNLERMLRDRLVCGMSDHKLQFELLRRDALEYRDVVDAMLSAESAGRDARMMHAPAAATATAAAAPPPYSEPPAPEPMEVNALRAKTNVRLCYRCGDRHGGECRFANAVCHYCKKRGHIEKICTTKKKNAPGKVNYADDDVSAESMNGIYSVGGARARVRVPAYEVRVSLDGVPVAMEVDSGAAFSILNERTWARLRPRTAPRPLATRLRTWNDSRVEVLGQATVSVKYRDIKRVLDIVIAKGAGPNLLGRDWFEALDISVNVNIIDVDMNATENVIIKYGEVFKDELGTYRGGPVTIHLKQNAVPKFLKARPVPYAIKEKVEQEIDRLVSEGVLRSVSFSEWATPVVPIMKKNGSVRLCGDYRSTVNQATESDTYPMPTASEVFATISGGKFYSTLDLDRAYTQVVVTDETAKLLTLNTCKGLYTVHRLAFGVKACPGIFQRLMTALLAGVPGVAVLIDDVIISGRTMPEMTQRLDTVLARIEKAGLRLNGKKCKFAKERVEFLGFVIDADGIHPAASKVESILQTPEPKNIQQLQAFLGLYNFYERFIPHKATILEPLHRLLDKSQTWTWTDREQHSFNTAKRLLSSDLTLVHYDLNRPLVLTCDSSEYGAGAVLSHVMDDGQERPVAMGSRTLHSHERRYSQLDKEATAIMFGVSKFHNYLMGRSFMIVTDHKPLLGIFDPKRPIPNVLSPRLMRMALLLTSYNYDITYKPGPQLGNADGLSRWPQPVPEQAESQLCDILLMAETPEDFPIDVDQIAAATKRDKVLNRVSYHILCGWPAKESDDQLRPYWLHRSELSMHEECILLGCRVVVPPALREHVLRALHKAHSGIVQTKALARSYVWWPQMNNDIETLVQNCEKCLANRNMPPKTTYEWVTPAKPWSRLNIDFAGPYQNKTFLIIVDAYSKWPEVFVVNNMTSATVIRHLRMIFATHGLCETLVSDNGTAFISSEMKDFLEANKIKHIRSAPFHPSTNGLAERMVQTVKDKLRKMDNMSWDIKIPNMLLGLRATPCASTNKSPAELLFNRRLRTVLDSINPHERQRKTREEQVIRNSSKKNRQTALGQAVMYRNFSSGPRWLPGTIVSKEGPSSYKVETGDGNVINRHIDQLIRKQLPDTQTSSAEKEDHRQDRNDEAIEIQVEKEKEGQDWEMEEVPANQDSEQIIEIPSSDKWAEMLGIPTEVEPGYSGGKIKNRAALHGHSPYTRPNRDCNFMM